MCIDCFSYFGTDGSAPRRICSVYGMLESKTACFQSMRMLARLPFAAEFLDAIAEVRRPYLHTEFSMQEAHAGRAAGPAPRQAIRSATEHLAEPLMSWRVVDSGSLVSAFGGLVAPALGTNRNRGRGSERYHA